MPKKRTFVDKKEADRFRLAPQGYTPKNGNTESEHFVPSKEQLEEQHKFGIFYDDDYDYLQHLRDRNAVGALQKIDEETETVVLPAPAPLAPSLLFSESVAPKKVTFYEDDLSEALDDNFDFKDPENLLEDDFVIKAGGVVGDIRSTVHTEFEEGSEDENDEYYDEDEDGDDEDEENAIHREAPTRQLDAQFDKLIEDDYDDNQVGELDDEEEEIGGFIEPDSLRVKKLITEQKESLPEYDEEKAKEYVRARLDREDSDEEMERVPIEESARKRARWDCESFLSTYSNIYNHPTKIVESGQKLSRRALKRLDKEAQKIDEDEEMASASDEGESVISTVSTYRPPNETPEERKLRKAAVKEAKRARRVEKKLNRDAFAEERRRVQRQTATRPLGKRII